MKLRLALALSLAALLPALTGAAVMPPLPDTDQGRRASAYLEAFNTGNEDQIRAFMQANVAKSAFADRSLEERLEGLRRLRQDNGHLQSVRVLDASDGELRVLAKNDHDESLELDFLFEPQAPHFLLGMRMMQSTGEPGAAPRPAVQALPEDQAIRTWGAYLDSLTRADAFSGAVLVAKGNDVLLRKAYGLSSREQQTPNDVETRFNLGSINKIFTKLAIGQLVDEGKISLDATIDRYLPGYPKDVASKVTVRQLLEHRGGIGDIFGERYDRADRAALRHVSDWIPLFRDKPLAFEPGTKQQYSNGGYVLLGAIVEKVSGEDYYDYARRHIYGPLGLKHTDSYAMDESVPNLAMGYTHHGSDAETADWRDNRRSRPMRGSPAGGGYSTLGDLFTFTQAIRANHLLRPESARDFREVMPGPEAGTMMGGGAPGINAAVSLEGPYTIIVLANLDPPAAEDAAEKLRGWLGMGGGGGVRRMVRAGGPPQQVPAGGGPQVEHAGVGNAPKKSIVPAKGVSLEMLHSGHLPVVTAMVNGQGPFRFAIDTGAAGSLRLDSTLVARLGLEKVGEVRGGDPSGRNSRVMDLVEVQSLEIGGARFEGMTAAVRDYNERRMGDPVDGILGFGLFADCLLTLDYPGNRVKIERGELPAANGRDVLAFGLERGVPSVRLQVDSLWVNADVDAGSMGGFSLPASFADRLPLASAPRVVGRARTVSNEFEITAAELRGTVRLGANEFPGPTISFQPAFPMANVGSRVLRDFAITFDQKHRRMRLKRA